MAPRDRTEQEPMTPRPCLAPTARHDRLATVAVSGAMPPGFIG